MSTATTRGVVFIHSTPAALCPHIEWTLESILDQPVRLDWRDQPVLRGALRAECPWFGAVGSGSRIVSALRGWDSVRLEVTEDPAPGIDGSRWAATPELGVHHCVMSAAGDALVSEDRLRAVLARVGDDPRAMAQEVDRLLGAAWDRELEPFRHAGEGNRVRWLYKVS